MSYGGSCFGMLYRKNECKGFYKETIKSLLGKDTRLMRDLTALALILFLTGCSGNHVKKYEGSVIAQKELALVFTQHVEGSHTWVIGLDGAPLTYTYTRILELKPGAHQFAVANSPYEKKRPGILPLGEQDSTWVLFFPLLALERDSFYSIYFVEVNLKPGFTYVPVPLEKGALDEPAKQICLAEEPHDSPTARVNVSGELRYPSIDAPRVGCADRAPMPKGGDGSPSNWHRKE
jgi:hypothetical protein